MNEELRKGDIVLVPLYYSDLVNDKLRPSLVLYHDLEAMQLTVAYISSKISAKPSPYDVVIPLGTPMSTKAGTLLNSRVIPRLQHQLRKPLSQLASTKGAYV